MRNTIPSLVIGTVFGAGLALSDMINPARVLSFLDVSGAWDPTLIFVMVGAIVPTAMAYLLSGRVRRPLFGTAFFISENRTIDRQLIGGAAIFGIGWGLAGFCPGPAIATLVFGYWQSWLFVVSMLAGMALHRWGEVSGATQPPSTQSDEA
jgi:uncharacterized protein